MGSKKIVELIRQQGMLPLFYHEDAHVCHEVVKALYAAGIRLVEFTNRGDHALRNFKFLTDKRDEEMPGLVLAAGTIKNAKDAKAFIKAGAKCIISPGLDTEAGKRAQDAGVLWIPGCMSPTEIMAAESAGAELIKLFPGSLLGPGYLKAIREVFPSLLFVPTGGVKLDRENLKAWFDAGVCAVGMGSRLLDTELLSSANYKEISSRAMSALALIREIRSL